MKTAYTKRSKKRLTFRDRKRHPRSYPKRITNQKTTHHIVDTIRCNAREPSVLNAIRAERSNKKERRVDALALRADEGRDKLRKAAVRSKYPVTRRCPNGETRQSRPLSSIRQSITYGREPGELKHLSSRRKRKKTRFRQ